MIVTGRLAAGRSLEAGDFADLTDVPVLGVGFDDAGLLAVEFDGDIPPRDEAAVRRRIVSATDGEEQARADLASALVNLDAGVDLSSLAAAVRAIAALLT